MNKTRTKQWDVLVQAVSTAWQTLESATEALNEKLEQDSKAPEGDDSIGTEEERNAFEAAWKAYESGLEDCIAFAENEVSETEELFDSRSEKWQESEKGEALLAYKETWEAVQDIYVPSMSDYVNEQSGTVTLPEDEVDGPISEALTEVES